MVAPNAAKDAAHKRYPPWLEKSMQKMHHSRKTWETYKLQQDAKKELEKKEQQANETCANVWEAAVTGNVHEVQRFVEQEQVDLAGHHDAKGGQTILHYACWHGHLDLVQYVIECALKRYGNESLQCLINAIDTAYYRSTPLLETCRNNQGFLNNRLEIIRLLTTHGAVVEHQDAYGDNALHCATRQGYLPIVRYLLKCTDAAVFAAVAENVKQQKPFDIAKKVLEKKYSFSAEEVFKMLERASQGCNVRLKIQKRRKMRIMEEVVIQQERLDEENTEIDKAKALVMSTEQFFTNAHLEAEKLRLETEDSKISGSAKAAVAEAQAWLQTKDGKAWIKEATRETTEEVKELVKTGQMSKPKDMKKAAIARAKEKYSIQKEQAALDEARKKFRQANPPIEYHDLQALKDLLQLS